MKPSDIANKIKLELKPNAKRKKTKNTFSTPNEEQRRLAAWDDTCRAMNAKQKIRMARKCPS